MRLENSMNRMIDPIAVVMKSEGNINGEEIWNFRKTKQQRKTSMSNDTKGSKAKELKQ